MAPQDRKRPCSPPQAPLARGLPRSAWSPMPPSTARARPPPRSPSNDDDYDLLLLSAAQAVAPDGGPLGMVTAQAAALFDATASQALVADGGPRRAEPAQGGGAAGVIVPLAVPSGGLGSGAHVAHDAVQEEQLVHISGSGQSAVPQLGCSIASSSTQHSAPTVEVDNRGGGSVGAVPSSLGGLLDSLLGSGVAAGGTPSTELGSDSLVALLSLEMPNAMVLRCSKRGASTADMDSMEKAMKRAA
ncbi:hypothetical protein ACP70R_046043 [Stipagrostis hirtigluma subsp. patula]